MTIESKIKILNIKKNKILKNTWKINIVAIIKNMIISIEKRDIKILIREKEMNIGEKKIFQIILEKIIIIPPDIVLDLLEMITKNINPLNPVNLSILKK
jgi:hypothetical protein